MIKNIAIGKPQILFDFDVDNKPRVKSRPHARMDAPRELDTFVRYACGRRVRRPSLIATKFLRYMQTESRRRLLGEPGFKGG